MKIIFYFFLLLMYPGKRQIFIFYQQAATEIKNRQLSELNKEQEGLQERDITIQTFPLAEANKEAKKWHIDASKPFTVILIGKDGGEKLRLDSVLTTEKLFNTIDAMPMRKREMKEK